MNPSFKSTFKLSKTGGKMYSKCFKAFFIAVLIIEKKIELTNVTRSHVMYNLIRCFNYYFSVLMSTQDNGNYIYSLI